MDDLFTALVRHTHAVVDTRHGEYHLACPECGSESSPKHPKCSFSARGWNCFVCGAHGSLRNLAKRVELDDGRYNAPVCPQEARRAPATWLGIAEHLIQTYVLHPRAWELWQAYKPVSRQDFERRGLGVGVLPQSKCKHERLIVPIFDGTMVVGLRGRAIDCDCGKWLTPKDTNIDLYPLYNEDSLRPGCVVWIGENPADSLLLTRRTPYVGVATYSVAYWRERWERALIAARPEMVVVAYDQDLPGGGGAARREEFIQEWLKTHPRVPPAAGPRLVNRLRDIGLNAVLYDWGNAPLKTDIGSLLMGAQSAV